MPIYLYQNPQTEEVVEIVQSINDSHTYSNNGVKYDRIFTKPNASVDSKIDPNSKSDYDRYTSSRAGSVKDLEVLNKELSQKRAEKNGGLDPIKEKNYNKYKKDRLGKKEHPDILKRKNQEIANKAAKKAGIKIEV